MGIGADLFEIFYPTIFYQADEIFIQAIKDAGIYDEIWQAFAVFMPVLTVGVQGDNRTHRYAITLRAVTSQDGMTADWYIYFILSLIIFICCSNIITLTITNVKAIKSPMPD